jgi:hypothetical protein
MGVAIEYTAAQAIKILNQSEGLLVRSRVRRSPTADESPAHTFARHLMHGGNYGKGSGYAPKSPSAGVAGIRDRFLASPTDPQGNSIISSGWYQKGDMVVRLTELLNSAIGQEALRTLDRGASRVAVHYRNRASMKLLVAGKNVFDPKHASASYAVTPSSTTTVPHQIFHSTTGAFIKTINKKVTTPRTVAAVLDASAAVGIHAVLEKFGSDGLHVQTFFPSLALDLECFDYELGVVKFLVFQASGGKFEVRMAPRA